MLIDFLASHLFDLEVIKVNFNQNNNMETHLNSYFLVILFVAFLSSCEEFLLDDPDDIFAENEVRTYNPVIYQNHVIFRGEVMQLASRSQVEYGFMWFRSNESNPEIHYLPVGKRTSEGQFQATVMSLPRNEDLVVCAYVKTLQYYEEETIGEERDFYWGL